jgi:hypothetical protein
MSATFLKEIGERSTRWLRQVWQERARHRGRWISCLVVTLLTGTAVALLARRGQVSEAAEESPGRLEVAQADAAPRLPARLVNENSRPDKQAGAPAASPDSGSLRTIGALAAAHFYQTHLNLGFVADARSKGTSTNEEARKTLRAVLSLVDSVDRQLENLGKRPLDPEDRDSLVQMQAISALLRQQGTELQSYWDSGQDQDAAAYESLRKDCNAAINKLLAIAP